MKNDRRTILHLVALGRITPVEAERLLIAWNEGREVVWAIAGSLVLFIVSQLHLDEVLPGLARVAHALPVSSSSFFHHALALAALCFGGVL